MSGNRTNTLLLTVIGVATLLVAVIGATFAYFTANITGTEEGTTITVGAGKLTIAYADPHGPSIAGSIQPEADAPAIHKDFTITGTNSTTAVMPYSLALVIQSNNFSVDALKYSLTSDNTDGNGQIVQSIEMTDLGTGAKTIELGSGFFAGVISGSRHTYVLDIFFPETGENQDVDKGKSLTGYVDVRVGEVYTTTTTVNP